MFEHKTLQKLDEYFNGLQSRGGRAVYFYRISAYNGAVKEFLERYYEQARRMGVVIEGKIPNPDEKNLSYYEEIMGLDFQLSMGFLSASLRKWLPRMDDRQREDMAGALYDTLDELRLSGKNENMQKNAYIKFMCWLYYKFERIQNQLGTEHVPKLLYEGDISNYELKLLNILSHAGCDVVLLMSQGEQGYLKLDPNSVYSNLYPVENPVPFPEGYCIKRIREEMESRLRENQLYGVLPQVKNCTNAWMEGGVLSDVLKSPGTRGKDANLFYNCFCRINGVEDKLTYLNELYQFQLQLKNDRRRLVIAEHSIPKPAMDEIAGIKRNHYGSQEQMLLDLSKNIRYTANIQLQRLMNKAFLDILLEEGKKPEINLNKLTNKAVYLLCWLKRYQPLLFSGWKLPEIACFIYLGGCKDGNEAMFLRFLARLPVDVLILKPERNGICCLSDSMLYERNFEGSMAVEEFPRENAKVQMATAAYHAERELDTLMYQDSGMYRNRQYAKAVSVSLQTTYEEIAILWDQELKYRPNFSVTDGIVTLPVIFAKVSGVKDGQVQPYWAAVKKLKTEDTFLIKKAPFLFPTDSNPIKACAVEFLKNGRLQKNRIKSHKTYQYGFLRDEIQDYILDKLQLLIEQKSIRGTFENGTEYTIISTVLNLKKEIIRMIQKFDFTKKNPKLIYINTTESIISLEDSIMTAFLNLVGFDVVFFIPTGYENVEKYFSREIMEEHQNGEYLYDLNVPDFDSFSFHTRQSWRKKIFKRGN